MRQLHEPARPLGADLAPLRALQHPAHLARVISPEHLARQDAANLSGGMGEGQYREGQVERERHCDDEGLARTGTAAEVHNERPELGCEGPAGRVGE